MKKSEATHFIEQHNVRREYETDQREMHTAVMPIRQLDELLDIVAMYPPFQTVAVFKIKFK